MPRGGGGGGGFHSSFSHSSLGGSHSSYHHSSSSSSSSSSHSSHSSSHSYSRPSYSSNTTHVTNNVFVNNQTKNTSSTKKEPERKNYYGTTTSYSNHYDNYKYIRTPSKEEREWNTYTSSEYEYNKYKTKISEYNEEIAENYVELKEKKNNIIFKFFKIYSIGIALSIILFMLFISLSFKDIHKTVEDSFIRLNESQCIKSEEWYSDNWGTWINDESKLLKGLEYFYERTGAQPYVYIMGADGIYYSSEEAVREVAEILYADRFNDGGHILLVFREYPDGSGDWYADVFCGNAVGSVLGQETANIIMNNLIKYYEYATLTDEEFFSKTFESSANEIRDKYVTVSYDRAKTFGRNVVFSIISLCCIILFIVLSAIGYNIKEETENIQARIDRLNRCIGSAENSMKDMEITTLKTIKCPNCGASVNINVLGKGKCEYCSIDINFTKDEMRKLIPVE